MLMLLLSALCGSSCQQSSDQKDFLSQLLAGQSPVIDTVLQHPEQYRLQILYTRIDRDSSGIPHFTSYPFRLEANEYFYPASTVKLPAALLALEKMHQLGLDPYTPMFTDSVENGQSSVTADSSAAHYLPSVAHYIRKIMLVSDNDAFNRLYEFLGQEPIHQRLQAKGYGDTRIVHRLSIALSEEQNAHTNPVRFLRGDSLLYRQEAQNSTLSLPEAGQILLGKGEMIDGQLVPQPKDFSRKNAFPLEEQQQMLRAILFPELAGKTAFDLSAEDYSFLYRAMGQRPGESDYPHYPDSIFYDSYAKLFLYGDSQDPMPPNIRIFNKLGIAYGFLTDNAYIVDFESGVEFLLSATLYVNENGIFNDDHYEYDRLGLPFMAALGRTLYQYELNRLRGYRPDLSRFEVFEP